jgi:D-alanyl-D-alanine carboxypeptidase
VVALPTYNGATLPGPTTPARSMRPVPRTIVQTDTLFLSASAPSGGAPSPRPDEPPALEVVSMASFSSAPIWAIALDAQPSRSAADKLLLRTALQELDTLDEALRQVSRVQGGFEPSFVGLSERDANKACARLRARDVDCAVVGASG